MKSTSSKAKSYDYGLITSSVSSIPSNSYIPSSSKWYKTHSKVLLSGLGADEVFGGYARYKSAFERGGTEEMELEMSLDLDRLWHRNMGRDDRVISSNSKEVRFPYLDMNLIKYMSGVPTSELCDF